MLLAIVGHVIYLDYNATTPVILEVQEAMLPHFGNSCGNASSAHAMGRKSREAVENARSYVASLIGATPNEIVFTSGATESNQAVLRTFMAAGQSTVCSAVEHQSVVSVIESQAGVQDGNLIPVDVDGQLDCTRLATEIQERTPGLLSLIWANNETGVLSPVTRASVIAKERGWRVHLDGAQMCGKLPVDITCIDVDYLSVSAHKIYGPQGVGALYVREDAPFAPLLTGTQERGLRGGTEPVPLIVGFGEAARLAGLHIEDRQAKVGRLRKRLESDLRATSEDIVVNGMNVERLPNTTSVTFPGIDGEVLSSLLSEREIYVSTGSACKSSAPTPSHVLLAMGRSYEDAGSTLRISLSHLNEEEDVEELIFALSDLLAVLRL